MSFVCFLVCKHFCKLLCVVRVRPVIYKSLWLVFISCTRRSHEHMLLMCPRLQRVKETCTCKHAVNKHTHIHNRTHKHHCWAPQWKADAIIKGMIHLLIFKGLPSFQYISHFSLPLHLNLSIRLSLLMSLSLCFSVSQSIPSFSFSFVFRLPLSVW